MEPLHYLIAIGAGFVAGILNTLAGSGSLITLPFFLFLGLPAHVANGTNRVGILTQTFAAAITLYRRGKINLGKDVYFIIPTVLGSIVGAMIAVRIPEDAMRITIGVVMVLLLLIFIFRYEALLQPGNSPVTKLKLISAHILLFIIGIYGGFIQLGLGIFTLSALLLVLNYSFHHANVLKSIMNFFLTLPAFLIFAWNDQINWKIGAIVAIGQTAGAWVAARFSTDNKSADVWIKRLLIVMTFVSALKLFRII